MQNSNIKRAYCISFQAFESTFQIVMNEAWTDVTSEVMCRSSYWFVTNFYFIVIHLFSSLVSNNLLLIESVMIN